MSYHSLYTKIEENCSEPLKGILLDLLNLNEQTEQKLDKVADEAEEGVGWAMRNEERIENCEGRLSEIEERIDSLEENDDS